MSLDKDEVKCWVGSDEVLEDVKPDVSSGGEGSNCGSTTRRSSRPKKKPKRILEMEDDSPPPAPPKKPKDSGGGSKMQKVKKVSQSKIDKIRLKDEIFEEFRAIHNAQEKLRRKEQDFYMQELKRVLPLHPAYKVPNIRVLNNALAYIKYLTTSEEDLKAQITALQRENNKMKKYCNI